MKVLPGSGRMASVRITRRDDSLQDQIDLQNDRIENLSDQLEVKRARYQQQFLAMEQAIAALNQQSSALASLSTVSPTALSG